APVPGHREQVLIGEATANRAGLGEGAAGGVDLAGYELLDARREQQVAPLDTVDATFREEPAATPPPTRAVAQPPGEDHAVTQPERESGRPRHLFPFQRLPVPARQGLAALHLFAHEVGGAGVTLEIVERERNLATHGRVGGPSRAPGLPHEGVP